MQQERIALADGQVWITRGGNTVRLRRVHNHSEYFESYDPDRPLDRWMYVNGPDGLAGEAERQTFIDPSSEDLVELVI